MFGALAPDPYEHTGRADDLDDDAALDEVSAGLLLDALAGHLNATCRLLAAGTGTDQDMPTPQDHVDDALRAARHAQAAAEEALVRAERAVGEARLAEAATGAAIEAVIEVVDVEVDVPKA